MYPPPSRFDRIERDIEQLYVRTGAIQETTARIDERVIALQSMMRRGGPGSCDVQRVAYIASGVSAAVVTAAIISMRLLGVG